MADRLYLSIWLDKHSTLNMHRQFLMALAKFPFSTQSRQVYFRVSAVDPSEPALQEQVFEMPSQFDDVADAMERWKASDACFEIEGNWDLWQEVSEGWRLQPSRVNLFVYGPEFPSDIGESVKAELGVEALFLPLEGHNPADLHYYQSNIKSLLRLAADWTQALRVKDRRLWSESGDDFSARLKMSAEMAPGREN